MHITISQPLWFSKIGEKDNQEDWLEPQLPSVDTRCFVLCDGMGGHEHGEVASKTVSQALQTAVEESLVNKPFNATIFQQALDHAYDCLDAAGIGHQDDRKKMGTTMTCLVLHSSGYLIAHIGDSRIYHLRPNNNDGILHVTVDHSLVNQLLRAGEITEQQAANYPYRNVITRAMMPLDKRYKATIFESSDICAGDYFLLCSDGLLERLTEERLLQILRNNDTTNEQKLEAIKAQCFGDTYDNYSCYLVNITNVIR